MKKLLVLVIAVAFVLSLTACSKKTYEIALITDVGTVTDKSFNQGAWEGVLKYADEFDITHKYYQPSDQNTDEYVKMIDLAVEDGAKIIVTPGFFFENAIWLVQDEYPDVMFIILDGSPNNVTDWDTGDTLAGGSFDDWDFTHSDNVLSIMYAEHESGFLAGYAAVKDEYTDLGFMGGKAVPAVVKFGYGFVQGANYAAEEMGLTASDITIMFNYLGGFGPDAAFQSKAAAWFDEGTEVIFAAAGGAGGSVMKAAEQEDGKVIGVDVDQSGESDTVITSALKNLGPSVYESLKMFYNDEFPGGTQARYDAANLGVALPDDYSHFSTFTVTDYEAVLALIVGGTIIVDTGFYMVDEVSTVLTNEEMAAANTYVTIIFID